MKSRCNTPTTTGYHRYGGRGIKVCERWNNSFDNFWADIREQYIHFITHNRDEKPSIDRIDNNGDYTPENVRIISRNENTRRSMHGNKKFLGHKHSIDTRKRMSTSHKGKKLTEETKRNMSEAQKGRKKSAEHIQKIRESAKKRTRTRTRNQLGQFI